MDDFYQESVLFYDVMLTKNQNLIYNTGIWEKSVKRHIKGKITSNRASICEEEMSLYLILHFPQQNPIVLLLHC